MKPEHWDLSSAEESLLSFTARTQLHAKEWSEPEDTCPATLQKATALRLERRCSSPSCAMAHLYEQIEKLAQEGVLAGIHKPLNVRGVRFESGNVEYLATIAPMVWSAAKASERAPQSGQPVRMRSRVPLNAWGKKIKLGPHADVGYPIDWGPGPKPAADKPSADCPSTRQPPKKEPKK
ncbi:MAG: hypothetical protein IT285_16175 [Bdellovibrionales bacterium]|nr:hypothetical protein [Bdellovibrionales bacterium]